MRNLWRLISLTAAKAFLSLSLDIKFLAKTRRPISEKLLFVFKKYQSILLNHREIRFLGHTISFDNRMTPALMPDYINELELLGATIALESLKSVFDIGANIGQFSYVLKQINPSVEIFSFEPNLEIAGLLRKNASQFDSWKCFTFGIGEDSVKQPLYFVEGKSGQGSLFRENAAIGLISQSIQETSVEIRAFEPALLKEFELPGHVDLIKIDVEGAERSVLKGLGGVSWKYIYLELSDARDGALSLDETLHLLRESRPQIKMQTRPQGASRTYQVLISSETN